MDRAKIFEYCNKKYPLYQNDSAFVLIAKCDSFNRCIRDLLKNKAVEPISASDSCKICKQVADQLLKKTEVDDNSIKDRKDTIE